MIRNHHGVTAAAEEDRRPDEAAVPEGADARKDAALAQRFDRGAHPDGPGGGGEDPEIEARRAGEEADAQSLERLAARPHRAQSHLPRRAFSSAALALRRAGELLLAIPVVVIVFPIWVLPWAAAVRLGRFYGTIAGRLWPHARRVSMINLRRALGLDRAAARRTTAAVFAHLGGALAEGVQASRRRGLAAQLDYRIEDPELAARLFADPRPKLFVMAHLGSWELTAAILAEKFGDRGAAIVRPIDNPYLDRLVRRGRLAAEGQWIDKRGGLGEALKRLRAGDSVALLLDENAGRRGCFVDFFGRPASTHRSAALLALASGAQLLAGGLVDGPEPGSRTFLLAEVETDRARTGDAAVVELTQRLTALFESWIRERPTQWRWIHWRWRERPDGSSERYGGRELAAAFGESKDPASWTPFRRRC
jgi:KDO2-lipid IV(A) lauroyltransferase